MSPRDNYLEADLKRQDKARGIKTVTIGGKTFPTFEPTSHGGGNGPVPIEGGEFRSRFAKSIRAELELALEGKTARTVMTESGEEVVPGGAIRDVYATELKVKKVRFWFKDVLDFIARIFRKVARLWTRRGN